MPFRVPLAWLVLTGLASAPLAASAAEPLRIQMPYEPASLDPATMGGSLEFDIAIDLFEGLTTYSASGSIIPGVALRWETSADGLTWTFHLRSDAVWSDGTPLTAEDFVYSFRRALDPATGNPWTDPLLPILHAADISTGREQDTGKLGVEALDPLTLRIVLARPTPWLLYFMAEALPVPRKAVEKWGADWTAPGHMVSNGAYTLEQRVPLGGITLRRNALFHDATEVKVAEIRDVLADDSSTAYKSYLAGELDLVRVLGRESLEQIRHDRPGELRSDALVASTLLVINMDGPLGADKRVRQALSMVIDREVLETKIARRGQSPAYGIVPAGLPGYAAPRPDWAGWTMEQRIAAARKLLEEAGGTQPITIHVLMPKIDFFELYMQAIIGMWHTALGIEAKEDVMETRVEHDRVNHHDFEIELEQWNGDFPNPWTLLSFFDSTESSLNVGEYRNPEFDGLLDQARGTAAGDARMALLQRAEKMLQEDVPAIPINHAVRQMLVNPRLRGLEPSMLGVHPSRFLSIAQDG